MKVEHIEAIERARRHGIPSMVFAHQLMVRDLVEAALFELRNIKVPFPRLGEDDQQEVIERLTKQAEEVVTTAIGIISARSVDTIPVTVVDAKFKAKAITVTAAIDAQDPNRHGLIDVAGKLCLLVLAPNDYAEGTDGLQAERDQRELPLSAGAIAQAMYRRDPAPDDEPESQSVDQEPSPQSEDDIVDAEFTPPVKGFDQFGEFSYTDASQVVVLHGDVIDAAWLQRRLSIDSEMATSLLLRLLEDHVIQLEAEAEERIDYTYKVCGSLAETIELE